MISVDAGVRRERSLRSILASVSLERYYRIIPSDYRKSPLGAGAAASRFGAPAGEYTVLYAADTVGCAVYEAIVRGRFDRQPRRILPRSDVENRHVVELRSIATLQLIDLRGDRPRLIGVPTDAVAGSAHHEGQVLSASTYWNVPEADGFLYPSRHTADLCVAIFDRASDKLSATTVECLIRHRDLFDVLDHYRIALA